GRPPLAACSEKGQAVPYSASVQRIAPLSLIAMRDRVAVPPLVAAGTTAMAYVPPVNGCRSAMRPPIARVHAVAPVAVEVAVIVDVTVPSAACTSVTESRLPSESSRCPRPLIVAVHATTPVERTALTVVVATPELTVVV